MAVRQHIEALCKWPHRGSTTEFERQAAEYLVGQMKAIGLDARLEQFSSHTSFSWTYLIIYGGLFIGGYIGWNHPFLGILLCALMLVLFYGECTSKWKALADLLPKRPSQNVLGIIPNRGAAKKVVLVAHYDSSKSGLSFHPSTVGTFRQSFIISVVMMLLLLEILVIRSFYGGGSLLRVLWVISLAYLLLPIILLLHRELFGQYVQGASDNASGVAAMLAVAEGLAKVPPKNLEVWCLATGCEEVNLMGMTAFLQAHQYELDSKTTYFINFDNLGSGSLRFVTAEGMLTVFPSAPELVAAAEKLSQTQIFKDIQPHVYKLATLDALVASSRGYKTISLMALDNRNGIPHWHWPTDVLKNIDFTVAEKAAVFARTIVEKIND
jgi:hypothetical protein